MEEFVYYNELFDCYKSLLTRKEVDYFGAYYSDNLSYSEIAENYDVSRSIVQRTIKIVIDKLDNYEKKLKMFKLKTELLEVLNENDINKIKKIIEKVVED